MERDRWEQIERLYYAALEREPGARDVFLDEACAGDAELRREVAGLLACDVSNDSFIQSPAIEMAGHQRRHPTRHGQAQIEEFNHALNLTPALRRLQRLRKLNSAKPLEVTLVLLPADDSASAPKTTASLKLPFREAILQISR